MALLYLSQQERSELLQTLPPSAYFQDPTLNGFDYHGQDRVSMLIELEDVTERAQVLFHSSFLIRNAE